jgi:hypothetical protein
MARGASLISRFTTASMKVCCRGGRTPHRDKKGHTAIRRALTVRPAPWKGAQQSCQQPACWQQSLHLTLSSGRSTGVLGMWSRLIQLGLNHRSTLPVLLRYT